MSLRAIALNCTLKPSGESSTDVMIAVLKDAFAKVDVTLTETVRIAALDIKPGVTSDEGDGDDWPAVRERSSRTTSSSSAARSGWVRSAASPSA